MGVKILVIGLLATLGTFCIAQDDPPPCDFNQMISWGASIADPAKLSEILTTRNFTAACEEIVAFYDIIKGCGAFATILNLPIASQVDSLVTSVGIVKSYCGLADPARTDICDFQSISTCAVSVIGTWQMSVEVTTDVDTICGYYDDLITMMDSCIDTASSSCTADQRAMWNDAYVEQTSFLRTAKDICGDRCKGFIELVANQGTPECQYPTTLEEINALDPSQYCTYIKNVVKCLENEYNTCSVFSPTLTMEITDTAVEVACALGCNFTIFGTECGKTNAMFFPPCASVAVQCGKNLAALTGLTTDLGPDGGYNVNNVMSSVNMYVDSVMGGEVMDICTGVTSVLSTTQDCITQINSECNTGTVGEDIENIVSQQIAGNISDACTQECQEMVTMLTNVQTCADSTTAIDGIVADPGGSIQELALGFVSPGGGNAALCEVFYNYVGCVLKALISCPVLYDNYQAFVQAQSPVPYAIELCNIKVDLSDGSIVVNDSPGINPVLWITGGASSTSNSMWMCVSSLLLAVLAWRH